MEVWIVNGRRRKIITKYNRPSMLDTIGRPCNVRSGMDED